MPNYQIANIDFHDNKLLSFHDGTRAYVAAKPICEILGIDWSGQRTKLKSDPVFAQGMEIISTPSDGGMQETVCLAVELLQAWMMSINPNKVREEFRAQLNRFRAESAKVLSDYWNKGIAINPRFAHSNAATNYQGASVIWKLQRELKASRDSEERAGLILVLEKCYQSMDLVPPNLSQIGFALPNVIEGCAALFETLAEMEAKGLPVNHHRMGNRLAINWNHLDKLAKEHGFDLDTSKELKDRLHLHPRFISSCTVNSRQGASYYCDVFERGH